MLPPKVKLLIYMGLNAGARSVFVSAGRQCAGIDTQSANRGLKNWGMKAFWRIVPAETELRMVPSCGTKACPTSVPGTGYAH